MVQKLKFKPVVTRVKLNPEQAVLFCACYSGILLRSTGNNIRVSTCVTRVGANKCVLTASCRSTSTSATSS